MSRRLRYIAVVGSRCATLADVENAVKSVRLDPKIHAIVSGGARGADTHARTIAERDGFEYVECPAFWDARGKSAGFERNLTMIDLADAVIAVWDGHSKGTKHSIDAAHATNTKVSVFVPLHGMASQPVKDTNE